MRPRPRRSSVIEGLGDCRRGGQIHGQCSGLWFAARRQDRLLHCVVQRPNISDHAANTLGCSCRIHTLSGAERLHGRKLDHTYAPQGGRRRPIPLLRCQAIAAPFFPGFSLIGTTASELGSDRSTHPSVFNAGAILQGVACLVGSVGFFRAFRLLGTHPVLAWLTSFAVAVTGLASLWAGCFPLPDPRHVGHPAFLIAILSLPPLFAVALWRRGHVALKSYLVANLNFSRRHVPNYQRDERARHPYLSRAISANLALTVFLPIGIAAYVLAKRVKSLTE